MKILKSEKGIPIPKVVYVTEQEEIKDIPIGTPFIFGDSKNEKYIVRLLEYEVLYQAALKSGYPFDFRKILKDNGYSDIESFNFNTTKKLEYKSSGMDLDDFSVDSLKSASKDSYIDSLKNYIRDCSAYLDIQKLKDLQVFPTWLTSIEEAIETNLHRFATFDTNMYNKKLDGMYGGISLHSPNKNLIIIDISGSIPRSVSATCLALSKNLAESFYADLLITGSKSTLYPYEEIQTLDVNKVYEDNGMDNDQVWFRKLVSGDNRKYQTVVVFGDFHSPSYAWSNPFNRGSKTISTEEGKKICKWQVEKVISFNKESNNKIAGYADWFEPDEVEHIPDWVKYLK